jgi:hypothetical protein
MVGILVCEKWKKLDAKETDAHLQQHREINCEPSTKHRRTRRAIRLQLYEVASAREQRLLELQMGSIVHEMIVAICFLSLLFVLIYSQNTYHSFSQMNHLRQYFNRGRDVDLLQVRTKDEFWAWLNTGFVDAIRAQAWYNGDIAQHLSGYTNDKVNRLIGWPSMRQIRMQSSRCAATSLQAICYDEYAWWREETRSFDVGWQNTTATHHSTVDKAFLYRSSNSLDSYVYVGGHGSYSSSGYVYEFRGRLNEIRRNLFALHDAQWIDAGTRAVLIQLNLYNPNVQLFVSIVILAEFLNTGGVQTVVRIDPIDLYGKTGTHRSK